MSATVTQLSLFQEQPLAPRRPSMIDLARAAMGAEWENFRNWAQEGNRSMCAAVLWQRGLMFRDDAARTVDEIAGGRSG